jgi:hypothetical protein
MSDDGRFETFLRDAAEEHYNPPPGTPREEIWAAVREDRATARWPDTADAPGSGRLRRVPWGWAAAVAAALALGVGLGRWVPRAGPDGLDPAQAEAVGSVAALPADAATGFADPAAARAAEDLFSRSEVLLALLPVHDEDAAPSSAAELRAWARPLLQRTRLLLDAPVRSDPVAHRLLEDLELVLAQIVALESGDALDRELVEEGVRSRALLFRLRAAAGAAPRSL